MIKLILVGVWVCAATIISAYFTMNMKQTQTVDQKTDKLTGGAETVKTKMISVPVIADGVIQGYVIAQFVFVMDAKMLKRMTVQPEVFLLDEAFSTIYTGGAIDFRNVAKQDLKLLAKTIEDRVNARLGGKYVQDVLIEELNYMSKDEAREGMERARDKKAGKKPGAGAKGGGDSHAAKPTTGH
jgi:hypothetical protein